MKKTILWIMLALLVVGTSMAFTMPLPVDGRITGTSNQVDVKITNLRSGHSEIVKTSPAGEFLVDWSNVPEENGPKYSNGDVFEIRVLDCEHQALCLKTIKYTGQDELFVTIDVTGEVSECQVTYCNDWTRVGVGVAIALIIAIMGYMGGGIKVYKTLTGKTKFLHRHKGILGYHDPNTKHRNPKYRHRTPEQSWNGFLADVKKIEEDGGL